MQQGPAGWGPSWAGGGSQNLGVGRAPEVPLPFSRTLQCRFGFPF